MPRLAQSLFGLFAASLLAPALAQAQARPPATEAEALTQLMQIENDIIRANQQCDYGYFRRIEADEFIFTGGNGSVITREQDLAGEKDCKPNTNAQHVLDEPRLLFHGTFAVLNARNSATLTRADGQIVTIRTRFTDVFVWRDARWQLIAGHSSRIPSEK